MGLPSRVLWLRLDYNGVVRAGASVVDGEGANGISEREAQEFVSGFGGFVIRVETAAAVRMGEPLPGEVWMQWMPKAGPW